MKPFVWVFALLSIQCHSQAPVPKKLTAKHAISPEIARLAYRVSQTTIKDFPKTGETYEDWSARNQLRRDQIDEALKFDVKTRGDVLLLQMLAHGLKHYDGDLCHKLTTREDCALDYDPDANGFMCVGDVFALASASPPLVAMSDSQPNCITPADMKKEARSK